MNHSADDSSRAEAPLISDRMRELLIRIAQDQVAKQRSQEATLATIRGRLDGVEWVLQGVRDREIGPLVARLESLEAGVGGVAERPAPGQAEHLAERVDEVGGRLDGVREHVDGLDDRVTDMYDRLDRMPAALRVAELHRRLTELGNRPFIDYSERIDAVDERVKQAELRVAEVVSDVGRDIRARPDRDQMERAVGEIVGGVVDRAFAQIDDRLAAVEESVLALAEALLRGAPEREGRGGDGSGNRPAR